MAKRCIYIGHKRISEGSAAPNLCGKLRIQRKPSTHFRDLSCSYLHGKTHIRRGPKRISGGSSAPYLRGNMRFKGALNAFLGPPLLLAAPVCMAEGVCIRALNAFQGAQLLLNFVARCVFKGALNALQESCA